MRGVALVLLVLAAPAFADDEPAPPQPAPPPAPDPDAAKLRELEHRLFVLEHPPKPVEPPQPLDIREPTFGEFDFGWMNGNNSQPASLLQTGPLTLSLYVDAYYGYQFHDPIDHTVFPTTTAPRHDEISLNLAHLGADVTGLDGPIGRLYIQYGSTVETIAGQDTTTTRGFYLTNRLLQNIQQAAVGWHFHRLHGINTEVGIFPSYVGLESYLPEENWAYNHAFLSDWTPYYFFGFRGQLMLTQRMKLELWIVNGWQTFGEWHEARAGGGLWNWRPREWLSIASSIYAGQEAQGDTGSLRLYTDNNVQVRYFHDTSKDAVVRSLAASVVADLGHEHRGNAPSGYMGGISLANHVEWTERWKSGLRIDFAEDETQAISTKLPVGSPYTLPGKGKLVAGGVTATVDYWPSPWLVTRLEYAHRAANQPYFSGPGGITGPGGVPAMNPATFTPDLLKSDDRLTLNVTLRL
jgi:hypothetical protein